MQFPLRLDAHALTDGERGARGRDEERQFQLYESDPSGNYGGWKATAIGAGHQGATNLLKQDYKDDIKLDAAVKLVIQARPLCSGQDDCTGVYDCKSLLPCSCGSMPAPILAACEWQTEKEFCCLAGNVCFEPLTYLAGWRAAGGRPRLGSQTGWISSHQHLVPEGLVSQHAAEPPSWSSYGMHVRRARRSSARPWTARR